jgi:hypothetical protein
VGDCGEISFCQIATKIFERLTGYRPIRGASIEDLLNYRVVQYLRDIAVTAGMLRWLVGKFLAANSDQCLKEFANDLQKK